MMNIKPSYQAIQQAANRIKIVSIIVSIYCIVSCNTSSKKYSSDDDLNVINAILENDFKEIDHNVNCAIHPILIPASWYDYYEHKNLEVFREIVNIDPILEDMNDKDTIYIKTNDRLYQNEYFSAYLRELPKTDRLSREHLRERIYVFFSAIGYSMDRTYAIISVNVREFGNNGTGALLLLKRTKENKFIIIADIAYDIS